MDEQLYPYMIILPIKRKQKVLRAIFGSKVPIDILEFSISQGISEKIYQRDLIKQFDYSNKTIIRHLKVLTDLSILEEKMEKTESRGRIVWVKYYLLSNLGKWFALLLTKEEALPLDQKVEIICSIFQFYIRWMRELSEKFSIEKDVLKNIFKKEMI